MSAEGYDPDADDDDDERIIHPKTDQQRERLGNVVNKILLFSNLEIVSVAVYLLM